MKILSLIIFSIKENIKTKFYLVITIFSIFIIFVSLLLKGLSGFEQPQRILVNTGLAMIELFCLVTILLNTAGLLLQDIETKSIYIVLSKPISRSKYIFSKYIGLLCLTLFNIIFMAFIHLIFIKISNWHVTKEYFLALGTIFLKSGLIGSISLFTVVSMTSQTSAIITSFLLWIMGHFSSELNFIVGKIQTSFLQIILKIFIYLIPNFQYFNIKDYFDSAYFVSKFNIFWGLAYWLVYNSFLILFTMLVFEKKNL
jgi:ABC-type transport system involved in multi-copper enzyme maturation permease subunit